MRRSSCVAVGDLIPYTDLTMLVNLLLDLFLLFKTGFNASRSTNFCIGLKGIILVTLFFGLIGEKTLGLCLRLFFSITGLKIVASGL